MNYFVYILYFHQFKRTYVGQTDNLEGRLKYHNAGKVRSTKAYIPWQKIYSEKLNSRADAMKRERWFKSSAGRKLIKKILLDCLEKQTDS
jgi:putative endonuclease